MKWADDRGEAQGGRTGGEGKHPQGRELHQRRDDLRCSDASVMLFPQGLHMADIDKWNRKRMDWDRMEQVLLVSCFQFQPCLAEATDSAGSRRECTQCTKIPPTQAQLHPVWKLQTLTDRDIRKTGITAGKCEVHRDAQRQRQLCINNAAGVGPCN